MMGTQNREAERQANQTPSKTARINKYNPTKGSSKVKSYTPMEWQQKKLSDKFILTGIK